MSKLFNSTPQPHVSIKEAILKTWRNLPLAMRSLCAVACGYAALIYAAAPLFKAAVMQTKGEVPVLGLTKGYHAILVLIPILIWVPYIRSIKKTYLMAAPQARPFKIAAIFGIILSVLFAVAYIGVPVHT